MFVLIITFITFEFFLIFMNQLMSSEMLLIICFVVTFGPKTLKSMRLLVKFNDFEITSAEFNPIDN